jgi:pyruvate/2-oxoacid:ferredoxin oxidoreductase beta subunit
MTHVPDTQQRIKFYQTGTFTVGNRLLDDAQRTVQASVERANSLDSGHRACQGCGEALGARYAVDAALRAAEGKVIAANATGCLEVFTTPYPQTAAVTAARRTSVSAACRACSIATTTSSTSATTTRRT